MEESIGVPYETDSTLTDHTNYTLETEFPQATHATPGQQQLPPISVESHIQGEVLAGLPEALKTGIEALSGLLMDDVTVHYNSPRPAQVKASAYAQGTHIYLGPGQESLLAHEAWHIVQQKQGRAKPTLQAKGIYMNDDPELETEADVMGAQASLQSTSPLFSLGELKEAGTLSEHGIIQRWVEYDEKAREFKENNQRPKGYIPVGNYWAVATEELKAQIVKGDLPYSPDLALELKKGQPPASLWDLTIVKGDIHRTNDTKTRDKGCSVFVAADYMNIKVMQLLKKIGETGEKDLQGLAMQLMKQDGKTDDILAFYRKLSISTEFEKFDNYRDMIKAFNEDPKAEWTGALAWEGHIVRITKGEGTIEMWDPQGTLGSFLLPTNIPLFLFTFHS